MTNLDRVHAFFRAIERRDGSALDFYAPTVVQHEFPNRFVPDGATRDLRALAEGVERGKKSTSDERYEVVSAIEAGDDVALEVLWSAAVKVPIGKLAVGDRMTAHFGVFLTFRDGKIVSQRNYDCFAPF